MAMITTSRWIEWPWEIAWHHFPRYVPGPYATELAVVDWCSEFLGPEDQKWRGINTGIQTRDLQDAQIIWITWCQTECS